MGSEEHDPEQNDRRRPRVNRQSEGSDGDLVDDDDASDASDYSEDGDSDDEEIEIPDNPAHLARMAVLRAEQAALQEEAQRQNQSLIDYSAVAAQMREHVTRVQEEVDRLKALAKEQGKGATGAAGNDGCKPYHDFDPRLDPKKN